MDALHKASINLVNNQSKIIMPPSVSTEEATPPLTTNSVFSSQRQSPSLPAKSTPSGQIHRPNHQHLYLSPPQLARQYLSNSRASNLRTITRTTTRPLVSATILKQRNHTAATASRYSARARMIARRRASTVGEYRNLRQSIPSLRRQRDIGKVEVVTEAARYIDHLHRTLIERLMLCGIPDCLKNLLGTTNAQELSPQHIMNLVTNMAAKQPLSSPSQLLQPSRTHPITTTSATATTTPLRPPLAAATRLKPSQVTALPVAVAPQADALKAATNVWLSKA